MKQTLFMLGLLFAFALSPPTLQKAKADSLAVNFTSFDLHFQDQAVQISWETSGVEYPDYFFVERFNNSSKQWEEVQGSHVQPIKKQVAQYEFTDRRPKNGQQSYRVGQLDFDGQMTFTNVEQVLVQLNSISYYPNPTPGKLNISPVPDVLTITDMTGRTRERKPDREGNTDLSDLPPGLYAIRAGYPTWQSKTAIVQRE